MSGLFRGAKKRVDPASRYFERARRNQLGSAGRWRFDINSLGRPKNQILALLLGVSLAVGGVAASVAITIYGNNSTVAGQLSLGVGQAVATSCDQNTNVHTDTIGTYVDTYTDFVLQQVNVSQVDPNCGGKLMNLVLRINNGQDVNLTCQLPSSTSFSGATTNFSLATFEFATNTITTNTGNYIYGCTTGLYAVNPTAAIQYPTLLASIAASAVQIK